MYKTVDPFQHKALTLFSKYGIRSVNMDDLAAHMGVSKRTLYQMYSSKETLIQSLFEAMRDDWNQSIEKVMSINKHSAERLVAYYKYRYDYMIKLSPLFLHQSSKYYERINAMMKEARIQVRRMFRQILQDAAEVGLIRKPFQIDHLVEAHEHLFDFILERINPRRQDQESVFQHLLFAEMAGIIDPSHYNVSADLMRFMKSR